MGSIANVMLHFLFCLLFADTLDGNLKANLLSGDVDVYIVKHDDVHITSRQGKVKHLSQVKPFGVR